MSTKPTELPEWAAQTPPDIHRDYALTMTGQPDQDLDITRAEFIRLKRHLAEMRGYKSEFSREQLGPGFLVGPSGHAPRALSQKDFEQVGLYLDIRHSANDEACSAIDWLIKQASTTPCMTDEQVLEQSLFHYANGGDRSGLTYGVLAEIFGMPKIEDISEEEVPQLQHALCVLRDGGWFAEWLDFILRRTAQNSDDPARRYPTPLQVAATLSEYVVQYEDQIDSARELMEMRPDILKLSTYPPAAPETAQPTRNTSTKAPRARKPRKKHAHAKATA